jgi:hypothetical protein
MTIFPAAASRVQREDRIMNGQPTPPFEVHSEARGPHWVAWITRTGETGPCQSVLLIGQTQHEAETRARAWAAQVAAQIEMPSSSS